LVGLQIDRIVRNQISTLACFHVDHKAKNGTQLFFTSWFSLNLIVESIIAQGGSVGVRNHPEGEAQPNSEDDYQALLPGWLASGRLGLLKSCQNGNDRDGISGRTMTYQFQMQKVPVHDPNFVRKTCGRGPNE